MRRKRRTEITVETHEVSIIRERPSTVRIRCGTCGVNVSAITMDEVKALIRINPEAIYEWAEAGRVHFTGTSEGVPLICLNSLSAFLDHRPINR